MNTPVFYTTIDEYIDAYNGASHLCWTSFSIINTATIPQAGAPSGQYAGFASYF